jgi:hypothetical protein
MTREVLQQALEALEETAIVMKQYIDNGYVAIRLGFVRNAITAIKAALKQPDKVPVNWSVFNSGAEVASGLTFAEAGDYLTPERIARKWCAVCVVDAANQPTEQPEQEPLEYWNAVEGWVKIDEVREHFDSVGCGTIYKTAGEDRVPLYTSPQREWVGMTYPEYRQIQRDYSRSDQWRGIEAKLKEKNT